MLRLTAKCSIRLVVIRAQKKFTVHRVHVPKAFKCSKSCCFASRTSSCTPKNVANIVEEEDKRKREQREIAKHVAFNMVTKRTVSQQQLRNKLNEKGIIDEAVIQEILDKMVALELQSDLDYATAFSMTKWGRSKWSFQKIHWELKERHKISDRIINLAFKRTFLHLNDEEFDDEYYYQDLLRQVQARVDQRLRKLDIATKKRRITSWLSRRQHPWGTIYRLISEIEWKRES